MFTPIFCALAKAVCLVAASIHGTASSVRINAALIASSSPWASLNAAELCGKKRARNMRSDSPDSTEEDTSPTHRSERDGWARTPVTPGSISI